MPKSVGTIAARIGCLVAAVLASFAVVTLSAFASDPGEYVVAVHLPSRPPDRGAAADACIAEKSPAVTIADAVEDLVSRRMELINKRGGINGRTVRAVFYDDVRKVACTRKQVAEALALPNLIAMIGLWDSSRGSAVIDEIGLSGVPVVSELSVDALFAAYQNVFSLTRSVRHEQQVLEEFVRDRYRRIVVLGADDDLYTRAYVDHIVGSSLRQAMLVDPVWLKRNAEDNPPDAVDKVVAELKRLNPDLIFLSLDAQNTTILQRLTAERLSPDIFFGRGSVDNIRKTPGVLEAFRGSTYELAEGGLANLSNERLEQLKREPRLRVASRKYDDVRFGYGMRYADLLQLIAEGGASAAPGAGGHPSIIEVRNAVRNALGALQEGRKVWRGWAQDWSFTLERASSERSLLVWRPPGRTSAVLAPLQFVRSGRAMERVPVLQVHLDMTRVYRVDTNDKSFEADFFMTLRSAEGVPQKSIEFTNAYRSTGDQERLVNIRQIHQEPADAAVPTTRIFKVSGKFSFEPDLRKYPFDEQVFSISFQPESTAKPFLLQPPSEQLLGYRFSVDGWTVQDRYVGSNDLIIRSVDGELSEERIIPYYNFNYTWVMKRQVVDYVLRVLVPLTLILVVAYLANFIPRSDFDATIAIQVTALLSAIALYLALNQPSADDATLSDQIFVLAYASISVMIALSIFEVNTVVRRSPALVRAIYAAEFVAVPLIAVLLGAMILASASLDAGLWNYLRALAQQQGASPS